MRVLAGDIGGTKTLLCVAEVQAAAEPGRPPRVEVLRTQRFDSRAFPGLADAVRVFSLEMTEELAGETGRWLPRLAGFGVAGPVRDGKCRTTNLPWVLDARKLETELGLDRVQLANDFVALAHGIPAIPPERLAALQEAPRDPAGPCAVIGAGTGLGEAISVTVPGRSRRVVLAGEGGHADFAPRDELEAGVLRFLTARFGHVSWERLVCGEGMVNLAEALSALLGLPVPEAVGAALARDRASAPPLITSAARAGDPLCARVVQLFCSLYGAEAGNLALKCLPSGGVFVAGGIAPRLLDELRGGRFRESYLAKGRMRPLLEAFPVHVVLDDQAALLGASVLATA